MRRLIQIIACSALAAACSTSEAHLQPPADTVAPWVEAFAQNPQDARRQLSQVTDPVRRDLLILGVLSATPSQARNLCDLATAPDTRDHCDKLSRRPHLFDRVQAPPNAGPPPPTHSGPPVLGALAGHWDALRPDAGDCPDDARRSLCLQESADRLARENRVDEAGARCLAQPAASSRGECFFQASEQASAAGLPLKRTVLLCAGAGSFQRQCLSHAHAALADRLRDRPLDEVIPEVHTHLALLDEHWRATAPAQLSEATDQYLHSVAPVFLSAEGLAPERRAALPPALLPHLRSQLGRRVATAPSPFATAHALWQGEPAALPPADQTGFRCELGIDASDPRPKLSLGSGARYRLADPDPERDLELAVAQAVADLHTPRPDVLTKARHLRPGELAWLQKAAQRRH
jgi:hypothetical protein